MNCGTEHPNRRPEGVDDPARRTILRWLVPAVCATTLTAFGASARARQTDGPLVFAAASLTDVITEIAEEFATETGVRVRLSFAASSALARQIENGAPASVFLSANRQWMDRLDSEAAIVSASRTDIAGNRLALIAAERNATLQAPASVTDLPDLLGDGRLAVGDPDHVPAGLYARASLEALGLWDRIAPRLARTGDVRGALALVARGETPLGIVYATDARISDRVRLLTLLPADSHPPIAYPAALTPAADDDARAFLAFLGGRTAQAIFRRHGFSAADGTGLDRAS